MSRNAFAVIVSSLALSSAVRATTFTKVISIEGCHSVQSEPAWLASAPDPWNLGDYLMSNEEQSAIYLCDADLPDTATAFDTVGLEYLGGYQAVPPSVVAYANEEAWGADGARFSWVEAIGVCTGEVTPGAIEVPNQAPPIEVCQTNGGLSWASNTQAAWAQRLSIFFLVFVPAWQSGDWSGTVYGPEPWNSVPWNQAYRLIVQYEQ